MNNKPGRFFYGWVIVGVMAVSSAVSMAKGTLNFRLFVKPMGDDIGFGRAAFGWAQTARWGAEALSSPVAGALVDRYGSRAILPFAALASGLAMIAPAHIGHSWQLILLFTIMGLIGMSGPGALATSVPVLKWFVVKRGRALALMSLGIPVGAMLFFPLTEYLIETVGWETAWIILAITGMGILVPLAVIFVRRQPEDMGLLPDGDVDPDPTEHDSDTQGADSEEFSWTVSEAVRTTTLWRLVIVFSVASLAAGTIDLHRIPAFMDRGLDPAHVTFATILDAVCEGAALFAFGMLVRRIPIRILGAMGFAMLAIASVMTIYAYNDTVMFTSMAVFGLGMGGMTFLQQFIWADYFGRESVGSIRGLLNPINFAVGGLGPPVAGYIRDFTGTYGPAWWVGVALMGSSAVLTLATTAPKRPVEPEGKRVSQQPRHASG
ncbi:MAG: MFS transporter [Dehalococcoidia bacterium]|nr:MFS transporter [Dehalococcoidia bacterium]